MTPIVLFSGRARSGKDISAAALCAKFGGVKIAFADPIKEFLRIAYDLSHEQLYGSEKEKPFKFEFVRQDHGCLGDAMRMALRYRHQVQGGRNLSADELFTWQTSIPAETTPRHLMQTFGTECVRSAVPNFWLEHGLITAQEHLKGTANVVAITDGRFRNELLGVKALGGLCVRLKRDSASPLSQQAQQHASEVEQQSIPEWWFDQTVDNNHSIEWLQETIVTWASRALS